MIRKKTHLWYALLLIAAFAVFGTISISHMEQILIKNSQIMGTELAERFSITEESSIVRYELMLTSGAEGLQEQIQDGHTTEEIKAWMANFVKNTQEVLQLEGVELYASINNRIVSPTYWEGDATYDPTTSTWYKAAIQSNKKIVYTEAYTDVRLQKNVVTLCKMINDNGDVLAIDLYPDLFPNWPSLSTAPDGTCYFLCDASGTLLHYQIYGNEEHGDIQQYVCRLFSIIESDINAASGFITGMDSQKYGLYYHQASNGWISIITIPKSYLLSGTAPIRTFYTIIIIVALALCLQLFISNAYADKQAELYNKIARVLSNSYYALYTINFEDGTYAMLKDSDYLRGSLKPMGDYGFFLASLKQVIEPDAYEEFCESFSIENIRKLVSQNVRDFGGEFQRLFNNQYHWVQVQLLYDESLSGNEAVLCFRDVNRNKEKDLQQLQLLKDSLHMAQQTNESKTMFFSNMSHDMRTPLNAIIGLTNLAQHHLDNTQQVEQDLKKIQIAGHQLLDLVNDVLEISRLEQGKRELDLHTFNLKKHLEECLTLINVQAETQGKTFLTKIDIIHSEVIGDWFKLQQVLNNVLSNSFKFTPSGGTIQFHVQEFVENDSKYPKFQFTISDNGIGMSEEFLKKLFTPFERETRFTVAQITGTGLGMSIVYNLVTQMEGQIKATSELHKGTCITITLPMLINENTSHKQTKKPPAAAIDMTGKRILLVEDNLINMEIATELLKMRHFEVFQAWNGKEALDLFQKHDVGYFDAILMDMQMPVMDGCEATIAIRNLDRADAKKIPIIAVTANAFAEDITKTQSAGMNAHVSKPIDFQVLEQVLQQLLS